MLKRIKDSIVTILVGVLIVSIVQVAYAQVQFGGAGNNNEAYCEFSVDGGTEYTINGTNQWQGYVGGSADECSDSVEFHSGALVNLTGATFATAGGGTQTQITGVTHGLEVGDVITISGSSTSGYNNVFTVDVVGGTTDFTIDAAFVDDPTTEGELAHADHFKIVRSGVYFIVASMSGSISTSAGTFSYGLYDNATLKHQIDRRYPNAADRGAHPLTGLVAASVDDEIWFGVNNMNNSNNLDLDNVSFVLVRIR
jgi:hypothetical protein